MRGLPGIRVLARVALVLLFAVAVGALGLLVADWRARDADEVHIVEVPFATPGSDAVTAGRIIFVHRDKAENSDLIAHELVHVCQWERMGLEFLWAYSTEYVENLVDLGEHEAAYAEISFEQEARLGEVDCELGRYVSSED
ncbi:MAG: DUF4157 domain-containing protein [Actinomycetia bacterium]|nr:DUF4157 domain-containing protein [Actinomycetes bacterium]